MIFSEYIDKTSTKVSNFLKTKIQNTVFFMMMK
jgi:hypothetical protein